MMKKQEELELLTKWLSTCKKATEQIDQAIALFGGCAEVGMNKALYDLIEDYTNQVSARLGDRFEFASWYLWDNEAGENGLDAKARRWKKWRVIDTVEKLHQLIRASR